jgi:RND family efflux transporter MFP subunit
MKIVQIFFINKRLIPIILMGLLLITINGCGDNSAGRKHKGKESKVHVAKVVRQGLIEQQLITGTIEALSTVKIYNQESGRIKSLPYYPGDTVNKDQLIAVLDDAILIREFEKARAQHRQTKLDLKRLKRLIPRKLASNEQLTRAETLVEQSRAEKNLFKTRLSYSKISSPITGVITQRLSEVGDVVSLHSHILSIADVSQLKVKLSLSELTISQLKEGMAVSIRVDALGDTVFDGKILRIHPTIDTSSRQGTIEIIFNEVPQGAIPGQLCRIEINTVTAARLVIPVMAIRNDSIGEYVYSVSEKNEAKLIRIQTGIQVNKWVEVISGLIINDTIVTKGFQGLEKTKKVIIIDAKAKAKPKPKIKKNDKKIDQPKKNSDI